MTTQLTEAGNKLEAKRAEWGAFYGQFQAVGDAQAKQMTGEDVTKFKAYEAEVTDLQKSFDDLRSMADAAEANKKALEDDKRPTNRLQMGSGKQDEQRGKSLSDLILAKGTFQKGYDFTLDVKDIADRLQGKATMTTSANGYAPQVLRDGNVIPAISRPPQLIDFLRMDPTTQNSIKFMAQTVRTNAAAAKNEGSSLDESTITYAEQTDIISRIGTWIPVTQEQLEDEPGVRSLIDNDLILMVRQELDRVITVGTAAPPVFAGVFNATSIQTQAKGADPTLDALFKAITLVRVTGRSNPGVIVMHGTDHQNLVLTRTSDGLYILGNPTDAAVQRVWGLPIALSEALTVTNALVLDPFYFRVKMRSGVDVAISDSHASNFIANTLVVRAHVRAGLRSFAVRLPVR